MVEDLASSFEIDKVALSSASLALGAVHQHVTGFLMTRVSNSPWAASQRKQVLKSFLDVAQDTSER